MKTQQNMNLLILGIAFMAFTGIANSQTAYTWNGSVDAIFDNTANWTSAGVAPTGATSNSRLNVNNGTDNVLTYTSTQGTSIYSGGGGRALVIASSTSSGGMIISGGTFDSRHAENDLMVNGAFAGSLTISETGNYINTNGGGTVFFCGFNAGAGVGANATLNVSGGSFTTGTLQAGQSAGIGAGGLISTVNLDGGVLAANTIREGGNTGSTGDAARTLISSTFNFNGGTLRTRVTGTIMPATQGIDNVIVKAGGAIIDTNGFNTIIARPLSAAPTSGGLTKLGSGSLTLSAANTYTGATNINDGTLVINGATSDGSEVIVAASATLSGTGLIGHNTTIADGGALSFNIVTSPELHDSLALAEGKTVNFVGSSTLVITTASAGLLGDYTLLTAPGGFGASVPPANVALPVGWTADPPRFDGNSLKIRITSDGTSTPYQTWGGSALFTDDANGDGVSNGMAFLLGAASPNEPTSNLLPVGTNTSSGLSLSFSMRNSAARGTASLHLQHSSDLGQNDSWTTVTIPETSDVVDGITFTITPGLTFNTIQAVIPATEATDGKIFGRLSAVNP